MQYSDHMYKVAKNMMHRLRPSVLDEFGLVKALQSMIDEWNDNQDTIFCDFTFDDIPSKLSEPIRISLYRIIQESLTNALKYSDASKINIKMKKIKVNNIENINLQIKDNGIGVDQNKIKPSFGLLGMRERVEMNGGEFKFDSRPGSGVQINILVPIGN